MMVRAINAPTNQSATTIRRRTAGTTRTPTTPARQSSRHAHPDRCIAPAVVWEPRRSDRPAGRSEAGVLRRVPFVPRHLGIGAQLCQRGDPRRERARRANFFSRRASCPAAASTRWPPSTPSSPGGCDAPTAHLRTTKGGFAWSIVSEVPPVPLVTVVIPVFNRERTVVAAIESVLRQTYQSIEVIVVDDASTDGSIDAVRSVSDPRVRLVEAGTNRGAPGARNLGIATATGEFVAFQDSDDEWLPTKLQRQMDLFESRVVAVYCGMAIVEPQGSGRINVRYNPPSNIPNPSGDLLNLLLESSIVSTQTLVVRRNALDVVDGFDESLPATEDWDLAIRLAKIGPIIFVDDLLVVQRFSANSLTRNAASRLSALQQVVEKHLDEYQLRPRVLARRYYELAGGHRQFGNLRRAAGFLRKARQADRSFYRVWLGYLLLASHRLLRRS